MIGEGIRRARADVHQRHWTRPPKNGPGIITAVQEQIGLKLSPVKLPLDMVSKTKKAHCRAPATLRKGSVSNQCRAGSRYFERATRSGFRDDESLGNAHREFVWPVQPFQNRKTAETVARQTDGVVLDISQQPGAIKGTDTYFDLMDYIVRTLATALQGKP